MSVWTRGALNARLPKVVSHSGRETGPVAPRGELIIEASAAGELAEVRPTLCTERSYVWTPVNLSRTLSRSSMTRCRVGTPSHPT